MEATARRLISASALGLLILRPVPARGDAATEGRLRDALRSAQTQLRALEDERSKWQQREGELQQALEAAKKEPPPAPKKAGASERAVSYLRYRLAEEEEAVATLKASLGRCQSGSKEAADAARQGDAERGKLKAEVMSLRERLAESEGKNAKMHALAKEILDWVESAGARGGSEPVLGLRRVELENIAQDYQDKLIERKAHP